MKRNWVFVAKPKKAFYKEFWNPGNGSFLFVTRQTTFVNVRIIGAKMIEKVLTNIIDCDILSM